MKVAVVILNWNGRNFLKQFLPSVISHSKDAGIFVADNASSDDSLDLLKKEFPEVKRVPLNSNLGYAGGYNAALKQVDAEYYILLNSDVQVTPGWISPVIKMLEMNKSIGACQPKILSQFHPHQFEYAGAAGGYIDKYGYPFCRGRIFNTIEKDSGQYNDSRRIFWASGACLFVRASLFRQAGGFDETFFAHMEEIDFCWRIQKAGYEVWYCPDSKVYHVGGGTLNQSNPFKTYLNFRNNLCMLFKNLSDTEFKKVFMVKLVFDFLAALKFLSGKGGAKEMMAVYKAHRDFQKMKNNLLKSDNSDSGENKIREVILKKSILISYYLKGTKLFSVLKF